METSSPRTLASQPQNHKSASKMVDIMAVLCYSWFCEGVREGNTNLRWDTGKDGIQGEGHNLGWKRASELPDCT